MSSILVECIETHIGTCQIGKGTTANCVGGNDETVFMYVEKVAKDTELHPGELLHVSKGDFRTFWREAPAAAPTDGYGDDRGKQLQRHPADPGPEWG